MKQVIQNLSSGETTLTELPVPSAKNGGVLIRSTQSLLSAGTERMLVDFGRANWLNKARQQPEKVKMVLDKVKVDGLLTTFDAVRSKLDQPLPLGYCNVGVVQEVGDGCDCFSLGDRVASNGPHSEYVSVPKNLCVKVPDNVTDDEAAFTVISSIALQGVRLAEPTLGECFVVTGLGLVGLIAVQLLRANGCRVLGIDFDPAKTALARMFGAETVEIAAGEDPLSVAKAFSRNRGVDGVLLTLSSKSNEPVSHAARMCRKRGRIVLVGVTGLELNRSDFYEKEICFRVSCSYGPGRYDTAYEENGIDYPVGFVRWSERRNFEAVLDMMEAGSLNIHPLITHRYKFADASDAYDLLAEGQESYLGIILEYSSDQRAAERTLKLNDPERCPSSVSLGVVGAGNYAGRILIPAFRKAGARLFSLANSGGVNGAHYGRKYGFENVTTDVDALFAAREVTSVVVATQHNSHARLVTQAIMAGKHVFCEKPLALTLSELDQIRQAIDNVCSTGINAPLLMVGFNRRFSPFVERAKSLIGNLSAPKCVVMTVNAGVIPKDSWVQSREAGGGRIVGEGCHFIDLARHLVGVPIVSWSIDTFNNVEVNDDKAVISLKFEDGSLATIQYLANGHPGFPKERVEIFVDGRILQIDNFRALRVWGWTRKKRMKSLRQDKGQVACAKAFVKAVETGNTSPIPFDEIMEVSRVSIEIADAARV